MRLELSTPTLPVKGQPWVCEDTSGLGLCLTSCFRFPDPQGSAVCFKLTLISRFLCSCTWLEGAFQGHWLSGLSGLFIGVICDFSKLVLWEEGEEIDGELGLKEELLVPLTLP